RDVSAGEDEAVGARREAVDEIVEHAAEPGEALERAQLEELVEQERRHLAAAGPRARQERERRVKSGAGPGAGLIGDGKRRRRANRTEEALRSGRRALDVHVLRRAACAPVAEQMDESGSPAAASAQQDRNTRRR